MNDSPAAARLVFLVDVDNTLLDNDRFTLELSARLEQVEGAAGRDRYWEIFSQRRNRLGYADYLGTLQEFRADRVAAPPLLQLSEFLLDYPFAKLIYDGALEVLGRLRSLGVVVLFTDGDVVFQPRKIRRSGLWDAVGGEVLVCLHKQDALELMERRYPAAHYVAVDDKAGLLAVMKDRLAARLSTVFVRQGHYAREAAQAPPQPAPDLAVDTIGALLQLDSASFSIAVGRVP